MFDPSQIKKDLDAVIITVLISQSQFALNCQLLAIKVSGGRRVFPYISYIGMCPPIGYRFCAVLVGNF